MKLVATPHSLSPFPLIWGRGNGYIREAKPLFDSPLVSLSLIRRGGIYYRRGADAPLRHSYVTNPEQGEANL